MSKQQKKIAIIAGAALAAWLLYSYIRGRQVSSTSTAADTSGTPVDTSASDFASLAGQEQGDVAALQNQNSQLLGQEQSDVAALQGQEGSDVSNLTGIINNLTTTFTGDLSSLTSNVAAVASGEQAINRNETATVKVNKGNVGKAGTFADYYQKVTGKAPPATISVSNIIYQSYKAGVKAAALTPPAAHPSAPKNTNVAHPNANHTPQTGTTKKLSYGGQTATVSNKPKTSGKRK